MFAVVSQFEFPVVVPVRAEIQTETLPRREVQMAETLSLTEKFARIAASTLASGNSEVVDLLQTIVTTAVYFILAAFGAAIAEIFASRRGPHSSVEFWTRFFPRRGEIFHLHCDFFVKIILGSVIALATVAPTNERQAIAAGIGWAGALTAYLSSKALGQEKPVEGKKYEADTPLKDKEG
jgi:hypothetical protein